MNDLSFDEKSPTPMISFTESVKWKKVNNIKFKFFHTLNIKPVSREPWTHHSNSNFLIAIVNFTSMCFSKSALKFLRGIFFHTDS